MNVLSVEKLSKSFGERDAFRELTFGLALGEKVALVARNGTGKTTLLRSLTGEEQADTGTIVWRTGIRWDYLRQDPQFPPEATVLEVLLSAEDPKQASVRAYEALLSSPPAPEAPVHDQQRWTDALQAAMDEVERLQAWDVEAQVKAILQKLQIGALHRPCGQLSGGQRKRAALARVLLSRPEVLILDEPTNHLDLDMIEWLEDYLSQADLTLLLVTHDRYFLDTICTRILELEGGSLHSYAGNYEYFLEKKAEREASLGQTAAKARSLLRTELEWLRRQPKARTTKSKARIDTVGELQARAALAPRSTEFRLEVKMTPIGGKILDIKNMTHRFGELLIVRNFTYSFRRGERLGIVGRNGVGKSTLLNLLLGLQQPTAGQIDLGETIVPGYFRQDGLSFRPGARVIDHIRDIAEALPMADGSTMRAEQFLLHFQFSFAQQAQPIELLSGGERRRLHLLTVLIRNPNLLILDEPTNDLDLITLGALEEFLLSYPGVLIVVSHDRYFLDRLVDHLWILPGDGSLQDFHGNYQQWRSSLSTPTAAGAPSKPSTPPQVVATHPTRGASGTRMAYRDRQELETLEREIPALETEKAQLEQKMSHPELSPEALLQLSERYAALQRQLEAYSLRWLELAEKAEAAG